MIWITILSNVHVRRNKKHKLLQINFQFFFHWFEPSVSGIGRRNKIAELWRGGGYRRLEKKSEMRSPNLKLGHNIGHFSMRQGNQFYLIDAEIAKVFYLFSLKRTLRTFLRLVRTYCVRTYCLFSLSDFFHGARISTYVVVWIEISTNQIEKKYSGKIYCRLVPVRVRHSGGGGGGVGVVERGKSFFVAVRIFN